MVKIKLLIFIDMETEDGLKILADFSSWIIETKKHQGVIMEFPCDRQSMYNVIDRLLRIKEETGDGFVLYKGGEYADYWIEWDDFLM